MQVSSFLPFLVEGLQMVRRKIMELRPEDNDLGETPHKWHNMREE